MEPIDHKIYDLPRDEQEFFLSVDLLHPFFHEVLRVQVLHVQVHWLWRISTLGIYIIQILPILNKCRFQDNITKDLSKPFLKLYHLPYKKAYQFWH